MKGLLTSLITFLNVVISSKLNDKKALINNS